MIFMDFQRFSRTFKETAFGQPLAPWGWMLNDEKVMFRVGRPPKTGPVSQPPRPPSAAIGGHPQPSAPAGWVLNDEKVVFRVRILSKTGPVSRPDRQPSAPIGGLWVGVKRGYGSPPSNSPRLSILVIYKVDCWCCLLLSHAGGVGGSTPRGFTL